jgi:hypothetical protein
MVLKSFLFGDSTKHNSLGNKFRQKRMLFFKDKISRLPKPIQILDVGGNEQFWRNSSLANDPNYEITILNLDEFEVNSNNMISVIGDATDLAQYTDKEFDVAFSNSVIEHLHNRENQQKMAREVQRVGRFHFIQVPNKYFFLEPHYLLPFFNFLPKSFQYFILTKTKLSRGRRWDKLFAKQYVNEIVLLSNSELQSIFPHSQIWKERFLGLSKSFVAHNFNDLN